MYSVLLKNLQKRDFKTAAEGLEDMGMLKYGILITYQETPARPTPSREVVR